MQWQPELASPTPQSDIDARNPTHAAHTGLQPMTATSSLTASLPSADSTQSASSNVPLQPGTVQDEAGKPQHSVQHQQHPEVQRHGHQHLRTNSKQVQAQHCCAEPVSEQRPDIQRHAAAVLQANASGLSEAANQAADVSIHQALDLHRSEGSHAPVHTSRSVWSMSSSSTEDAGAGQQDDSPSSDSDADSSPHPVQTHALALTIGAEPCICSTCNCKTLPVLREPVPASVTAQDMGPCFQPEQFILDALPTSIWDDYVLADYTLQIVQQSTSSTAQPWGAVKQMGIMGALPGCVEAMIVIAATLQSRAPVFADVPQHRAATITAVIDSKTGRLSLQTGLHCLMNACSCADN